MQALGMMMMLSMRVSVVTMTTTISTTIEYKNMKSIQMSV